MLKGLNLRGAGSPRLTRFRDGRLTTRPSIRVSCNVSSGTVGRSRTSGRRCWRPPRCRSSTVWISWSGRVGSGHRPRASDARALPLRHVLMISSPRRDSHPCHRVESPASSLLDDEAMRSNWHLRRDSNPWSPLRQRGEIDRYSTKARRARGARRRIRTAGLRRVVPAL